MYKYNNLFVSFVLIFITVSLQSADPVTAKQSNQQLDIDSPEVKLKEQIDSLFSKKVESMNQTNELLNLQYKNTVDLNDALTEASARYKYYKLVALPGNPKSYRAIPITYAEYKNYQQRGKRN